MLYESSNLIDKKVYEYDISQVFSCFSVINIIRDLTNCELYNKKREKISNLKILNKNMFYGFKLSEHDYVYHEVKDIINKPNFKLLNSKVIVFNTIKLSNEYKYYIIQKFYKDIDGKTVNLMEMVTNRKNVNVNIIKQSYKKGCELIENYLNFHLKTLQYESIMINKELYLIYNFLKQTNLFKKYDIKNIKNNENEIEIYGTTKNKDIKISLIKISDFHSYVQYTEQINNKIKFQKYQENKKILQFFLKKLKELLEKE